MLIKIYASGTNIQRLAKGAPKVDGVIYTAYSQLEQSEESIIKRKFFMLEVDTLKHDIESLEPEVQPSWAKIWGKPNGNKSFITKLFKSFIGEEPLRQELNLSNLTGESVDCFMLLVSANNKEMRQIKDIAIRAIPNYHIKILNGDFTSNKEAESETIREINEAKIAGKDGLIIISNQMGSRSYSISEIQASVIAYDRGSVDTTIQKVSRCLTPGNTFSGESKEYGHIVDLSFDPNRSENIEKLLVEEIMQVHKSEGMDFPTATRFVLSSIDCFRVKYGTAVEVTESEMFTILNDNENLLRVADVTVNIDLARDIVEHLENANRIAGPGHQGKNAIDAVKNYVTETDGKRPKNRKSDKDIETIINEAIKTINRSARNVHYLYPSGETYKECLENIIYSAQSSEEFYDFVGIDIEIALMILDKGILNEPILDVVVQNTKKYNNLINDFCFGDV
jgi:hypothetical protein